MIKIVVKTNIHDSDLYKLVQLMAQTGTPENDERISKKLSEGLAGRRDRAKIPRPEETITEFKRELTDGAIRAGYSTEEAGEITCSLEETINDPERWSRFLKTRELSERHGAETFDRVMQGMTENKEQRAEPKPGPKAWTGEERKRRSKPSDGTPGLP